MPPPQSLGVGCIVANLMFDLRPVTISGTARSSSGIWLGETVATFGLVVVVLGLTRRNRASLAPVRRRCLHLIGGAIALAVYRYLHPGVDPTDLVVPDTTAGPGARP